MGWGQEGHSPPLAPPPPPRDREVGNCGDGTPTPPPAYRPTPSLGDKEMLKLLLDHNADPWLGVRGTFFNPGSWSKNDKSGTYGGWWCMDEGRLVCDAAVAAAAVAAPCPGGGNGKLSGAPPSLCLGDTPFCFAAALGKRGGDGWAAGATGR
eukprot:gene10836-biopygen4812